MFDADDDDDDDSASTTTSSSSPDYDDDDVENLLDRSRKLIVKAKDAECKRCANRRQEFLRLPSGDEQKRNGAGSSTIALRNGGDWNGKEWKAGDNASTFRPPPAPPPPVADDLQSCQSSMTSFVASRSRRDPSSSSESREELSVLCRQRSSLGGSTTGEKPSRCQRGRDRQLDCLSRNFNPVSDEQKAGVVWRANARCQQVAPYRPQLRSFLSDVTDSRCPVINIRKATVFVNSRIGSSREKNGERNKGQLTKDLSRQTNSSDRPKAKTGIQSGSFRCHRPRPPSLQSLELDGDSAGDDWLPAQYPSPSYPSSPSPFPCPSPVSDDIPAEMAPEMVGGNASSSEMNKSEKEKEKCSLKRMLDLTIVLLIVAVVLLSLFGYVFGPPKTRDTDPPC